MRHAPFALFAMLAACDYNVLIVEVESREICVSGIRAEFPGGADGVATATLEREEVPEGEEPGNALGADLPEGFELIEVTFLGVGLEALEGIDDFGFVQHLTVSMTSRDPNVPLPPVQLIDFEHSAKNTSNSAYGSTKYLPSESSANLLEYLEADVLELRLEVDGDMPESQWAIGLDVCFTFVAEYRKGL